MMMAVDESLSKQFAANEALACYLKDEMGLRLDHVKLGKIVGRLKRSVGEFSSFESFSSAVASLIAVHETYFLRHQDHFGWIEGAWLSAKLSDCLQDKKPIRILSAGCATGEEPYSLYAHLTRLAKSHDLDVQIDAVDVSEKALSHAEKAYYGLWSLRGVNVDKERDWLDVSSRHVIVKEWVRQGVSFSRVNITQPFFESKTDYYDLILCRNVLIYMHDQAIEQSYSNLARLLKPGGFLLPGPSDPNPNDTTGLKMLWADGVRIFSKRSKDSEQARKPIEDTDSPGLFSLFSLMKNKEVDIDASKLVNDINQEDESIQIDNECLLEALLDDEHPDAFFSDYQSIESLMKSCEYDTARKLLQANIQVNPLDTRSYVMLSMLALDLDDKELARLSIQKACYLRPDAPYTLYLMTNYKQRIGDKQSERQQLLFLRELLMGMPKDASIEFCEEICVAELIGVIDARIKK